jgi:DNA repair exonuclease SbcCD nuclease subunit
MRIGITGDLQFDTYDKLSSAGRSRLKDILDCCIWVADSASKQGCEALALAGDIHNDRVEIAVPVINAVSEFLFYASDKFKSVGCFPGNHDSYMRDPSIHSLASYARSDKIQVFTKPGIWLKQFGMVPWYDDIEKTKEAVNGLVGKVQYLFSHALVKGNLIRVAGIDPEVFRAEEFNHVFVGDNHQAGEITERILSVGAPCQFNYGDAGKTRGFWILDTEQDELSFVENTESRRFHVLKAGEQYDQKIRECDYVRVEGIASEEIRKLCPWVEAEAEQSNESPVRADFSEARSQEEIMRAYFNQTLGTGSSKRIEKLVAMSMRCFEDVASGQ